MTTEASGGATEYAPLTDAEFLIGEFWLPGSWIRSTKWLQEQIYGYPDPSFLTPAQIAEYLNWNQVAAVQELAELREEFHWKPWATDEPFVNVQRVLEESVDILHFVGNILHGIGVTDEQFWEAYRAKQLKNIRRATSGNYSAQKGGLSMGSENE